MTAMRFFTQGNGLPATGHYSYLNALPRISINDNQDEALRRRSLARREGLAWDAFASDERPGSWVPSVFEELEQ